MDDLVTDIYTLYEQLERSLPSSATGRDPIERAIAEFAAPGALVGRGGGRVEVIEEVPRVLVKLDTASETAERVVAGLNDKLGQGSAQHGGFTTVPDKGKGTFEVIEITPEAYRELLKMDAFRVAAENSIEPSYRERLANHLAHRQSGPNNTPLR